MFVLDAPMSGIYRAPLQRMLPLLALTLTSPAKVPGPKMALPAPPAGGVDGYLEGLRRGVAGGDQGSLLIVAFVAGAVGVGVDGDRAAGGTEDWR